MLSRRASRMCRSCSHHFSLHARSVDVRETGKFEAEAERWWDTSGGPFAPLHAMNPVRCAFVREALCRHFGRDSCLAAPLAGLRLLDVGCGGGLLCVELCSHALAHALTSAVQD